jgi:hypothetical protein
MRFMMLLKSNAETETQALPDEAVLTAMGKYNEAILNAGIMRGGEGLHPSVEGARVRIQNGKTTIVDGPFTEAKELIAGYYLIETKSLQEALAWAQRIPAGEGAEVEVRRLWETEDFPVDPAETAGGWRDQEEAFRAAPPPVPTPDKGPRWMSMLKADKNTEAETTPAPDEKLLREMGALMGEMIAQGLLIGGDGLRPTSQGYKVRFGKNGTSTVIDGPFTETKEIIAGTSLFRAKTKAEAVEWARRCLQIHMDGTGIDTGEIEVRRVHEIEEFPVSPDEKPDGWRATELRMRQELAR